MKYTVTYNYIYKYKYIFHKKARKDWLGSLPGRQGLSQGCGPARHGVAHTVRAPRLSASSLTQASASETTCRTHTPVSSPSVLRE